MKKKDMLAYILIIVFFASIIIIGLSFKEDDSYILKDEEIKVDNKKSDNNKKDEENEEEEVGKKIESSVILDVSKGVNIENNTSDINEGTITKEDGYLKDEYNIEELSNKSIKGVVEPIYTETGLGDLIILTSDGGVYTFSGMCRMAIINNFEKSDDCVQPLSLSYLVDKIGIYKVYDYLNYKYYSNIIYYSKDTIYNSISEIVEPDKLLVFGQESSGLKVYSNHSMYFNSEEVKDGDKIIDCKYIAKTSDYYIGLFYVITSDDYLYKVTIENDNDLSVDKIDKVDSYANNEVKLQNGEKLVFFVE